MENANVNRCGSTLDDPLRAERLWSAELDRTFQFAVGDENRVVGFARRIARHLTVTGRRRRITDALPSGAGCTSSRRGQRRCCRSGLRHRHQRMHRGSDAPCPNTEHVSGKITITAIEAIDCLRLMEPPKPPPPPLGFARSLRLIITRT